jgi:hypothetical protein
MSTTATRTVPVDGIGPVEVTIAEYGSGQPFLLLHGGAGPASVAGFAELLAATGHSPQLETPDLVLHAMWDSAGTDFSAFSR